MKKPIVALLISLPVAAVALDTPPAFSAPKIEMPSSSLIGDAQQKLPPFVSDFLREIEHRSAAVILTSRMPIIVPVGQIDPKMVKGPDLSVDYDLIVKPPAVVPVK
jgi:hypothetical protein